MGQAVIVYDDGKAMNVEQRIVGRVLVQRIGAFDLFLRQLRKGYLMLRKPRNMLCIITGFLT